MSRPSAKRPGKEVLVVKEANSTKGVSPGYLLMGAGVVLLLALMFVALAISSSYNPTPTNSNSGGPGSTYPNFHHSVSYSHPIDGNGPQSS